MRSKHHTELLLKGICIKCEINHLVKGEQHCQNCIDDDKNKVRARVAGRVAKGLCSQRKCQNPLVAGTNSCEFHLIEQRKRVNSRRKARNRNKLCPQCGGQRDNPVKKYCSKCLQHDSKFRKNIGQKIKMDVMLHYSTNKVKPVCECCGESILDMLNLDHIDGGGNKHRKVTTKGKASLYFYRWIIKNDYPKGYRVFCYNCNYGASRHNGICPHTFADQR